MAKETRLKVEVISYTKNPEQVVVAAIRQCYSSAGASDLKKTTKTGKAKKLIKKVVASGHTSTIEHASFTFAIKGVSRACTHELVRHRIASYSQQSQRYVNLGKKGVSYIVPPELKKKKNEKLLKRFKEAVNFLEKEYQDFINLGIKPEDARSLLPNACEAKIVVTMNARCLKNFFKLRMCQRSQWEIRNLASKMATEVKKIAPAIFANVGPTCMTEKICWEGEMSCGLWKKIEGGQLKNR
jgi:thymidylate synthase (FAD)